MGYEEQNRTSVGKSVLLLRKIGLGDHLEQRCRPEFAMWVDHPASPVEAQFQSLLGIFPRGTLEACDDFSYVSPGDISLWKIIQLPLTNWVPRCFFPPTKKSLEGILFIAVVPSAMWWLLSATSYPQPKATETTVEVPGTEVATVITQILHTDKGPPGPGLGQGIATTQGGERKFANPGCP